MGARADVAEDDGGASAYRGDGKVDRESRSNENQRRTAFERIEMIAMSSVGAAVLSRRSNSGFAREDTRLYKKN